MHAEEFQDMLLWKGMNLHSVLPALTLKIALNGKGITGHKAWNLKIGDTACPEVAEKRVQKNVDDGRRVVLQN